VVLLRRPRDMEHAITIAPCLQGREYKLRATRRAGRWFESSADSVPETEHEEVLAKSAGPGARIWRLVRGGVVKTAPSLTTTTLLPYNLVGFPGPGAEVASTATTR